ncbi:MAG: hydroxymethylglutaryl-CoA reductase, degradative [Eubacterium sp.]
MAKNKESVSITKMSVKKRQEFLKQNSSLSDDDIEVISGRKGMSVSIAAKMVENVVGVYSMPYYIVPGFIINGKKYIVPMVGEEPYIATSTGHGAELAAKSGGFTASDTGSIMIGQVQLTDIADPSAAKIKISEHKQELIEIANKVDPVLISFGGGCIDIQPRIVDSAVGTLVVTHLLIDCKDAMGAQSINAMAEAVAPELEKITGARANVKVLSNLAVHRLVRSRVLVSKEDLGGEDIVDKFISAYAFANADPYRATTNNKGIMNGMIPVVVATGNDTRAVESGVHAYASISGRYRPVAVWEKNKDGDLEGSIEVPMAVGIVGGTTKFNPTARASLKLMGIGSANELARVIATVGLAANLGVLYSLVTVGLHSDFDAARK